MNLRARRRILKIGDVAGEVVEIGLEQTAKVETVGDAGGFGARGGFPGSAHRRDLLSHSADFVGALLLQRLLEFGQEGFGGLGDL